MSLGEEEMEAQKDTRDEQEEKAVRGHGRKVHLQAGVTGLGRNQPRWHPGLPDSKTVRKSIAAA